MSIFGFIRAFITYDFTYIADYKYITQKIIVKACLL